MNANEKRGAIENAFSSLEWYSINAEGNSAERPDDGDVETLATARAELAQYQETLRRARYFLDGFADDHDDGNAECVRPILADIAALIGNEGGDA
jgi:hypothetical protein